jgi:hypothetical protein
MADHLLEQICRALGVPPGEVLAEARRLKAMEAGMRAGAIVTPGMSPADVDTALQAAATFTRATEWTPLRQQPIP